MIPAMNNSKESPRIRLIRESATLQLKLVADGLRDALLIPVSLVATVIGLLRGGEGAGDQLAALVCERAQLLGLEALELLQEGVDRARAQRARPVARQRAARLVDAAVELADLLVQTVRILGQHSVHGVLPCLSALGPHGRVAPFAWDEAKGVPDGAIESKSQ